MIIQNNNSIHYKFIKEVSGSSFMGNEISPKKIEFTISDETSLEDLLETFRDFVVASGFFLEESENICIVKEQSEEENTEDEGTTDF